LRVGNGDGTCRKDVGTVSFGSSVGSVVGFTLLMVGCRELEGLLERKGKEKTVCVGLGEGKAEGLVVGAKTETLLCPSLGKVVGDVDGDEEGAEDGHIEGECVGGQVGAVDGDKEEG